MFILKPEKVKRYLSASKFKLLHPSQERFFCPLCSYEGPFKDVTTLTGTRRHARCPNCFAVERHRLQWVVLQNLFDSLHTKNMKMIHFAPEKFLGRHFSQLFGSYETADLTDSDMDHQVNLENLPFEDNSYHILFASHVLEHVWDDISAIKEISRIIKPGGMAILPVPIVGEKTIEYPEPNPNEFDHVRAPGYDYFDRYEPYFSKVERFSSDDLDEKYQTHIYEDWSHFPNELFPHRPALEGNRHSDIVPVCYI